MISGRQALATIEEAVARAREEERHLDATLKSTADGIARLRSERIDAFRALARHKLDVITQGSLTRTLDKAEQGALDLLAQRRKALEGLLERRRAADQAVQDREAERHAKAAALEEALKPVAALRADVEAKTRASPEWAARRALIDEAPAIAAEAEKKALQAEQDREAKGKPYEADPLFMYLWRKKFGTADDRSGPFVRFFDRRVARLVGYDKARANYALLNEIPQRLREHAARMKSEIANARERLKAFEQEALVQGGIEPLLDRVLSAKAEVIGAERRLTEARDARAALDREHDASVLEGEGPYRDAIDLLAGADSQADLQALAREAAATASPEDDAIVRRIQSVDDARRRAQGDFDAIRTRLRDIARRRAAIEKERDAFQRQGYDRPYSQFNNSGSIGNVLGAVLGGAIGGAVLRDTFSGGHQNQPGPWDSDFGGSLSDWIGGGSSEGGWGGGGGSDDGFGTGGTF